MKDQKTSRSLIFNRNSSDYGIDIIIRETSDGIKMISNEPWPDSDSDFKNIKLVDLSSFRASSTTTKNTPTKERRKKTSTTIPFYVFLTPEGQAVLPRLITVMEGLSTKPEDYTIMLYALQQLGLIKDIKVKNIDFKAIIYRSLKHCFGSSSGVGSYEAFRKNLNRFGQASAVEEIKIQAAVARIAELLPNKE